MYVIDDGKTSVMLDAGITKKWFHRNIISVRSRPENLLLTHEHGDHAGLVREMQDYGMEVYASAGTVEALNLEDANIIEECKPGESYEIGSWLIAPISADHDAVEPLSFVMFSQETKETMLFVIDSFYVRHKLGDINYLICECNHHEPDLDPDADDNHIRHALEYHMSLNNFLKLLEKLNLRELKEIYMIHMSRQNLNWENAKKTVELETGIPVKLAKTKGGWRC